MGEKSSLIIFLVKFRGRVEKTNRLNKRGNQTFFRIIENELSE